MREQVIDLQDVQGLVRGYGKSLPVGRFLLLTILDAKLFRAFLGKLKAPTTMEEWPATQHPDAATNIAFTYQGLATLGLPPNLLDSFPGEFKQGMKQRTDINSDIGDSAPRYWDSCWTNDSVHVWIGVYAKDKGLLSKHVAAILALGNATTITADSAFTVAGQQQVGVIRAPNGADSEYPPGTLLEHFGFADGLSEPAIEGVARPEKYAGSKLSKLDLKPDSAWLPLAPGEFLLGHYKDEADERPVGPAALELATNSTFMVYRKLAQNVKGFWSDLHEKAKELGIDAAVLAEQMVGRRRDGTPLVGTDGGFRERGDKRLNDFRYRKDAQGQRCPLGAHIRRANPRDSFGFGTVLVDRHRILRRGIPYGEYVPNWQDGHENDDRGLIFIALNASIARQFEFVQKRWINDGNTFNVGNDRDPIVGNHIRNNRFVLNAARNGADAEVVVCPGMRNFVATKGGEYFFLPGLGALRYLAEGSYYL